MSSRPNKSTSYLIYAAEIAINNSLAEEEILGKISNYGYTPEKINEGKDLLNNVKSIIERQASLLGNQKVLTKQLTVIFKEAIKTYQSLVKVARAVLTKEQLSQLGVQGIMPRSLPDFLTRANIAFNNALTINEINQELSAYGYNSEKIQNEYQKIKDLEQINQNQEAAKGEIQQLTKVKEAELRKLKDWIGKFIKIARVALSDNKQLLEKLGIKVYSSKTEAQRKAPQKAKETRNRNKQIT